MNPGVNRVALVEAESFLESAKRLSGTEHPLDVETCKTFLSQAQKLLSRSPKPSEAGIALLVVRNFIERAGSLLRQPALPVCEFISRARATVLADCKRKLDLLSQHTLAGEQELPALNVLRVFGVCRKEAPHSRFLSWLLTPGETHGLGGLFVGRFILKVQELHNTYFEFDEETVAIEAEKAGERGVPDIKIYGSNFLCVVENKIKAGEGRDQTPRYEKDAKEEAEQMGLAMSHLLLVFLTPEGRKAKSNFKPMSYRQVIALLQELLEGRRRPDTQFLVEQFIFNLRQQVLGDFDLSKRIADFRCRMEEAGSEHLLHHVEELSQLLQEVEGGRDG